MQTWIIGSGAQCDLVVNSPGVSGRHCRLAATGDGYTIEDLGSTNGTYVNGARITTRYRVTRRDTITLGLNAPMPWPPEPAARSVVLTIGREPDNDFVINLLMVSGHHARVIWNGEPGSAMIEDLGSANGTAVGSPDQKITRSSFTAADTIYLGSYAVPGIQFLARIDRSQAPALRFRGASMVVGRDSACDWVIDLPMVSGRHAVLARRDNRILIKDLGSSNGTFINGQRLEGERAVNEGDLIGLGSHTLVLAVESLSAIKPPTPIAASSTASSAAIPAGAVEQVAARREIPLSRELGDALVPPWRLAVLFLQAPLLALLIVAIFRVPQAVPTDPDSTKTLAGAIASILFWISLAAIWFGLSNAVLGKLLDRAAICSGLSANGASELIARLAVLIVFGGLQCTLAWLVGASIAGLQAPPVAAIGLLTLASAVGLALGLLIVCIAPGRSAAWGALGVVVVLLAVFGAPGLQLWRSALAGVVANASPSRWAFEGLFLLESDRRAQAVAPEASATSNGDLAETLFPAASERMGTRADVMALAFMFVGLAAGAAFIAGAPKPGP
jgi:pSer/pThr/pTyr-binding forkhead associated (FHA) protein